jgi:diguanylate cyclase (GGDEF)-like protein/PAS domain S-box-containing protein
MDQPRDFAPAKDSPLADGTHQQGVARAIDEHAIVAVTDRRGRITYVNQRFCAISGYAEHELLGQDHRILNSGHHPRSYMKLMWATIGRGRVWHGEFCNRAKDGSLYWVQSTIVPILDAEGRPDRYVSIRTDVSHIKRIEAELAASENRFRRLFERSGDAQLLLDAELGVFIDCNDATLRMLGMRERGELVGRSPVELSPLVQPDGRASSEKAPEMIDMALRLSSHRFEWSHCSPHRLPFPVEVLLTAITVDGQKLVLTTWRDITSRKLAEEWRAHYTRILGGLAQDAPIAALLDGTLGFVRQHAPGLHIVAHALAADGRRLLAVAAPGLPAALSHAVERCRQLSCLGQCVVLNPDLDPAGPGCAPEQCPALVVPAPLQLKALETIRSADGASLGSIALFLDRELDYDAEHRALIDRSLPLLALVIERARIREQSQLTEVVFRESAEAIVLTDQEDRVLAANPAFARFCGSSTVDLSGRSLRGFFASTIDGGGHPELDSALAQGGRWRGERLGCRPSGETMPLLCSVTAVRDHTGTPAHRIHVMTDLTDRKQHAAQIERLAYFDELTQLPNRALLQLRLREALERASASGASLALLCIDLDRFKEVNDSRGHTTGDRALVEVAQRFRLRLGERNMLARTGGDEFALIVENAAAGQAELCARELQLALQAPLVIGGKALSLGASIGVATFPDDGHSSEDLLRQADIAMYRAKSSGGGYCFYRESMGRALGRQLDVAARLAQALEDRRLQLHYQPLIDLRSGRLAGAEALLRWHDAVEGWMSPGEFIPVAEARSMMAGLGDWVFRLACRQVREWRDAGIVAPPRIAINLSAQQLGQPDLADQLCTALLEHGVEASCFELELTESSMVVDPEGGIAMMTRLAALGFTLAIDDFGTGYSSLSYLKRFPACKLKIDMSFVRDMLVDRNDHAIVETIIAMANTLQLQTVAEGVESSSQATALAAMGCDCAQGYHFGAAVPPDEFRARWLHEAATSKPPLVS